MLTEQTFQQLSALRLHGFSAGLQEQLKQDNIHSLDFEERISLLVDREYQDRENRKLSRRLAQAHFRERACIEDIDFTHPRGLDKKVVQRLASCTWVNKHQNVIVTGPTGVGKTYLACALAEKACRSGYTALYRRLPRLLNELAVARADGSYSKLLSRIAKVDVLVVDDWGLAPLGDKDRRDILEVFEDRYNDRSTVVAAQLPAEKWHAYIGDPTVADAIVDRLVHAAHDINLKGGSIRKRRAKLATVATDS